MIETEKCGDNCRYYAKHYVNIHGKYVYMCKGHCRYKDLTFKESDKRIKKCLPCEFKEPREIFIEKRKEDIKSVLTDIRDRIDQYIQIMKEE